MLVLPHMAAFVDEDVHPPRRVEGLEVDAIAERERPLAEAEKAGAAVDDPDRREVERAAVDAPQRLRFLLGERPRLRLQPGRRLDRPQGAPRRRDDTSDQSLDQLAQDRPLLIKAAIAASPLASSEAAMRSRTSTGLSWSILAVPRHASAQSSNPAIAFSKPS